MINFDRTDCIKSYFELVALVNKGNRVINEQTKASFFIHEAKLFIGVNQTQKYFLCKYEKPRWQKSGDALHEKLQEFLCYNLNRNRIVSGNVDEFLKRELFKLE